jgi:membrane protease YdiL (CAAX protease family)
VILFVSLLGYITIVLHPRCPVFLSYLIGAAVEETLFEVCLFKKHFARYSPWGVVLITFSFNLLGLADIFRSSPE